MIFPVIEEIVYQDPQIVFHFFANNMGTIFLESAFLQEGCGRYSFIAIDPFDIYTVKNTAIDPFLELKIRLAQFPLENHVDLPPFQGGCAGFFSYDLYQYLEQIPRHRLDDLEFPDMVFGFYDLVMAFDHLEEKAWIFSSGYPAMTSFRRLQRANTRLAGLKKILQQLSFTTEQKYLCAVENIQSNFSPAHYQAAVQRVKDYILAGDIFQANISQRFTAELPLHFSTVALYDRLRAMNPAPFSAFLNFGETILISASPERFLKVHQGQVETRPIKGTRARSKNLQEDAFFAESLLQSTKDHAENVMIVDLLRNDLAKVCVMDSIQVPQLCQLESFATVHHLVSVMTGTLRKPFDVIDLIKAAFPGGSITGAPKIRAMEIIAEIEPTARGPYCGSIAYIGFNGAMDSSITIRTYALKNNILTFQAGGGIVADSNPVAEYEETLIKAHALHKALAAYDFSDR